jgi:amino acid transporter
LAIGVATELIPTMSVIFGAPDLAKITTSSAPINDFILATSGKTLNVLVSAGMALAIFNAMIATNLGQSRMIFASGRDRAYPGALSDWMATVHPRFQSPWVATLVQGLPGTIFCLTVSQPTLISLTGTSLVFSYSFIAISAIVGRAQGATRRGPYQMPLWPLAPILSVVALIYIAAQQQGNLLLITVAEMAIGLVWWAVVILPQRGKAWVLKEPALDIHEPAAEVVTTR